MSSITEVSILQDKIKMLENELQKSNNMKKLYEGRSANDVELLKMSEAANVDLRQMYEEKVVELQQMVVEKKQMEVEKEQLKLELSASKESDQEGRRNWKSCESELNTCKMEFESSKKETNSFKKESEFFKQEMEFYKKELESCKNELNNCKTRLEAIGAFACSSSSVVNTPVNPPVKRKMTPCKEEDNKRSKLYEDSLQSTSSSKNANAEVQEPIVSTLEKPLTRNTEDVPMVVVEESVKEKEKANGTDDEDVEDEEGEDSDVEDVSDSDKFKDRSNRKDGDGDGSANNVNGFVVDQDGTQEPENPAEQDPNHQSQEERDQIEDIDTQNQDGREMEMEEEGGDQGEVNRRAAHPKPKKARRHTSLSTRRRKHAAKKEVFKSSMRFAAESAVNSVRLPNEYELADQFPNGALALQKLEDKVKVKGSLSCHLKLEENPPGSLPTEIADRLMAAPRCTNAIPLNSELPQKLNFTGLPSMSALRVSGSDVVDRARRGKRVFANVGAKLVRKQFELSKKRVEESLEFFGNYEGQSEENRKKCQEALEDSFLPVAVYSVPDTSAETTERLREIQNTTVLCAFRNVAEVYGLDLAKLKAESYKQCDPDHEVILRRQLPQSGMTNYSYTGPYDESCWVAHTQQHTVPLSRFMDHRDLILKLALQAREKIMKDAENVEEYLKSFEEEMKENVMWSPSVDKKKDGELVKPETFLVPFVTNLNVTDESKFKEAKAEIDKLPECLRPNSSLDLCKYAEEEIMGLNTPQGYLKFMCVRTTAHWENLGVASVNLNVGPGTCLWLSCPIEYFQDMDRVMRQKKVDWTNAAIWPIVEHLRAKKIPVQVFEQMPGDMVCVGLGTPHWVQANGFADNIAWNIVLPSYEQLAMSALIYDYHVVNGPTPMLPIESMLWNMVKDKMEMDDKMKKLVRHLLMRSLAVSQQEEDFIRKKNWEVVGITQNDGIQKVERCSYCQRVMFNYVTIAEDDSRICIQCNDDDIIKKVFRRYEMQELIDMFDSIIVQ